MVVGRRGLLHFEMTTGSPARAVRGSVGADGSGFVPPGKDILGVLVGAALLEEKILGVVSLQAYLLEPLQLADSGGQHVVEELGDLCLGPPPCDPQPLPIDRGRAHRQLLPEHMIMVPVLPGAAAVAPPQERFVRDQVEAVREGLDRGEIVLRGDELQDHTYDLLGEDIEGRQGGGHGRLRERLREPGVERQIMQGDDRLRQAEERERQEDQDWLIKPSSIKWQSVSSLLMVRRARGRLNVDVELLFSDRLVGVVTDARHRAHNGSSDAVQMH